MRKALKIVLPVLAVLLLLGGAYFYFFHYRGDLTAKFYVSRAQAQISSGNYEAAIKSYEKGYRLSGGSAEIGLALSQAYQKLGNYTKTEYYLVNAIADAPEDLDLYLALSDAYVQQDKLMEAQLMLDQVLHADVRAQLDALRPAAPVITPAGGAFDTFITVSVQAGDAPCYLTTNGQYPSLATDCYTAPIELPAGDTSVCAVCVGENHLVSTATYEAYTIAGVVEDVTLSDRALEAYVQELLNKNGRTLQSDDLWAITELEVPENVTDLSDLRWFTGLKKLVLKDFTSDSMDFLAKMPYLTSLDLSGCTLTSEQLALIGELPRLEELRLVGCGLSNISALSRLTGLHVLDLSDNSINDLTPLSSCKALTVLKLNSNAVNTVAALSPLVQLQELDLSHNALTSISALADCTALTSLNVVSNNLIEAEVVGKLVNLVSFDGSKNKITNLDSMAACKKLEQLVMTDNLLESIDFLRSIDTLRILNIDYNDVKTVPDFPDTSCLTDFSAAHNFLTDIDGLAGLPMLNYVNADYNNIENIDALASCVKLVQVNVFGTYVEDVSALTDHGIIVNYNPL